MGGESSHFTLLKHMRQVNTIAIVKISIGTSLLKVPQAPI